VGEAAIDGALICFFCCGHVWRPNAESGSSHGSSVDYVFGLVGDIEGSQSVGFRFKCPSCLHSFSIGAYLRVILKSKGYRKPRLRRLWVTDRPRTHSVSILQRTVLDAPCPSTSIVCRKFGPTSSLWIACCLITPSFEVAGTDSSISGLNVKPQFVSHSKFGAPLTWICELMRCGWHAMDLEWSIIP
jgi:hypothetical protein